ncbi:hypothetical protein [Deinococcus sp. QL22]|uniref:hypothetical protein n=1 Tax=Deinococcus sp. QL22 TaxID=2939437 RepID=UPI002017D4D5|nr:hypothetical protein [Deinococcus sp. QL22]UQN04861.1 hypothetical protein M1R55_07965 [Deinococcus sp. QL22]
MTDFGLIESLEVARDEEKRTLTGHRRGKSETYKELIDRSTFTATFQTSSTADTAVREWFQGSTAMVTARATVAFTVSDPVDVGDIVDEAGRVYRVTVAGVTGAAEPVWPTAYGALVVSGTATFQDVGTQEENSIYAYSNAANIATGGFIIVQSTEDSEGAGGRSLIRIFPNGNIQGTGNPDIQDFDGYEFTMTATKNRSFAPPVSLGNFGSAKPDGFVYDVPNDMLEAALTTLATALIAYV